MKPDEWFWVPMDAVLAIHDEQISEHGGIRGVRDLAMVDSALARPRNLPAYGEPDSAALAAAYAFGICNNHGFLDGNKRIAFTATDVFLRRNGFYIEVGEQDGYAFIEGSMSKHAFRFVQILDWIRGHIKPLSARR